MIFIPLFQIFLLLTLQSDGIDGCNLSQRNPYSPSGNPMEMVKKADKALNVGNYDLAIKIYRQLIQNYETTVGPEDPDTMNLYSRLFLAYFRAQKFHEALPFAWKIYKNQEQIHGKEHIKTVEALAELGNTYYNMKKYEKAEELLKRAYRLTKSQLGQNHKDTIQILFLLANVYRQGRFPHPEKLDLALQYFRKVHDVRSNDPEVGEEDETTLRALRHVGNILGMQRNFKEAIVVFEKVYEIRKRTLGESHPSTQEVKNTLVNTLASDGKTGQANEILRTEGSDKDKDDEALYTLVYNRATALEERGEDAKATKIWEKLYEHEILKRHLSPKILAVLDKLISHSRKRGDLGQIIKWANIAIDLVKNEKVKVTTKEDRERSVLFSLNAIDSLIHVYSEQDNEEQVDKYFDLCRSTEVTKGQKRSTPIADKILTLTLKVADFKTKIGKTDEATALYLKIAETPNADETKILPSIASIIEIAKTKDDYKMLKNVALKFFQNPQNPGNPEKPESEEKLIVRDSLAQYLMLKAKEVSEQENYESAFTLFKTVELIWPNQRKWTQNYVMTALVLEGLGISALKLDKFNEGFLYLEKVMDMYKEKLASETENELNEKERQIIAKQIKYLKEIQETHKKRSKSEL